MPENFEQFVQLFNYNVVEAIYNPKYGGKKRILCTCNIEFVASGYAKRVFQFNNVRTSPDVKKTFDYYRQNNFILVWDLLAADWRTVSLYGIQLVGAIPIATLQQRAEFMAYFNYKLRVEIQANNGKRIGFSKTVV